ncbi:MAG: glycine cleavage system protein GcvH [Candidatus Muiribacteriota bacterium]
MAGLYFTKTHEWVELNGDVATVGLSDYAQNELGDIVFVEVPEPGDEFSKGEEIGSIESVKTVTDYYAPLSGEITEVNEELEDAPETINEDAFKEGWIYKIKIKDSEEIEELMDESDYKLYMEKLQEEED